MMLRSLAMLVLSLAAGCGVVPEADLAADGDPDVGESSAALCAQPNYLQNPSFNTVGPLGPATSVTTVVAGGAGVSAAASWTLFTNTPGTVRTDIRPSTRPGDQSRMIHVYSTTGPGNGLVQVFAPINSGPTKVIEGAWVYVVRGRVGLGAGNGGAAGYDAFSTTVGQWQYVRASNRSVPANEVFIYGAAVGVNEFYVDGASVQFTPNLLANPTFATVGPAGPITSATTVVPGGAGPSASASWTLFTNHPGLITSQLVPSTLAGMTRMLHVKTQAAANGLVQVFPGGASCTANGPAHTLSTVWVYVNHGKVALGTGNGGNTGYDRFSSTVGQWEMLEAKNGASPANELIVYATSSGGADYYVGFARTVEIP